MFGMEWNASLCEAEFGLAPCPNYFHFHVRGGGLRQDSAKLSCGAVEETGARALAFRLWNPDRRVRVVWKRLRLPSGFKPSHPNR